MQRLLLHIIILANSFVAAAYTITARHLSVADGLTSNVDSDMVQDKQGFVWFCSANGINRYDGYSVRQFLTQQYSAGTAVRGMRLCNHGAALEISHANGTMTLFDIETLSYKATGGKNGDTQPTDVLYESDGVRYERMGRGRVRRTQHRGGSTVIKEWQLLPEEIITRNLRDHFHVARLRDGNEIMTTYGNGFFIYYPSTGLLEHHLSSDRNPLIRNNYITNLMIDRSGCVWMAEDWLGVTCLRFSNVTTDRISLPLNENPENNNIRAICPVSDVEVLVSNNVGDIYSIDLTTKAARKTAHYEHRAYCMMLDNSGRLWVGTRGGGLFLDGKRVEGSEGMNVYQLKTDAKGNVWVAAMDDGIARIAKSSDGKWRVKKTREMPDVRRIAIGKDGKAAPDRLPHGVMAVESDGAGNLWRATESGLLCTFANDGGQQRITTAVSALGDVYNENASARMRDGRLLFGSHDGLVVVDPLSLQENSAAGTPVIVNYTANDLSLPHDSNTITLQFSTLHYATLPDTRYEYRMIGLDTLWREPTSPNAVTFQALRPRRYTFCVRNASGGREMRMQIRIREPWWNTGLAWAVYALLTAALTAIALHVFLRFSRLRSALRMEQRMAHFRSDFYRKILQEIRNPLNVVQGISQNITHSDSLKSNAQNLRRSSRRLLRIFQNMEEFYRNDKIQSDIERLNDEAQTAFNDIRKEILAEEQTILEMAPPPANQHNVVVVERDEENRLFVERLLSPYVKVFAAAQLCDLTPELLRECSVIVVGTDLATDDVYSFTREMRQTRGVQLIHLTSNDSELQRLKSVKSGAGACLTKPYNSETLVATVLNMLTTAASYPQERERAGMVPEPILSDPDDHKWRERLLALVEQHIADSNFSVETLGQMMKLGRTQLNKKVKSVTGLTPSQLIKTKRMERAAAMLKAGDDTIESIMMKCGMNSANLFYADFKKQYGCTPAQYKKQA